jgi:hypothetical protein
MMTVEAPALESARIAAVLHDVVEDTEWTVEREAVGPRHRGRTAPEPVSVARVLSTGGAT